MRAYFGNGAFTDVVEVVPAAGLALEAMWTNHSPIPIRIKEVAVEIEGALLPVQRWLPYTVPPGGSLSVHWEL